jgi:Ni,Fe-hydrogenase III small subunit
MSLSADLKKLQREIPPHSVVIAYGHCVTRFEVIRYAMPDKDFGEFSIQAVIASAGPYIARKIHRVPAWTITKIA